MEMQSETVGKLVEALIDARKDMDGAVKHGKGNWGAYASLEDLLECCMNPLLYNGIMMTQPTIYENGVNQIVTQLTHTSGEWMKSAVAITVVKDNDPQKALAGQTYARRGGIETILSIPRIDDDGESQVNKVSEKEKEVAEAKKYGVKRNATNEMIDEVFPAQKTGYETPGAGNPVHKSDDRISTEERNAFIIHVKESGVSVEAATKLLKLHKFETSACITVTALPFLTKEISKMGGVGK